MQKAANGGVGSLSIRAEVRRLGDGRPSRFADSSRRTWCIDEHMAGDGPDGYRVCSLYLDTPQLALYRQSKDGIKNRYKLRIRFYDEDADGPAFLEIKQRTTRDGSQAAGDGLEVGGRAILARRAAESGRLALEWRHVAPGALTEFCDSRDRLKAEGVGVCRLPARGLRFAIGGGRARDVRSAHRRATATARTAD